MLLTVAGASCSGKTTTVHRLVEAHGGIDALAIHDFDEIGVPSSADTRWRQRSLEQWIRRALDYQRHGLDVLLAGHSPLGEVLACPSAPRLDGIAACLLDVSDAQRRERLMRRDPAGNDQDTQRNVVAWARWHRDHARDPHSRPEVVTLNGWEQMRWDRWTSWDRSDPLWQVTVIDTTGSAIDQSTDQLARWIALARRRPRGPRP